MGSAAKSAGEMLQRCIIYPERNFEIMSGSYSDHIAGEWHQKHMWRERIKDGVAVLNIIDVLMFFVLVFMFQLH